MNYYCCNKGHGCTDVLFCCCMCDFDTGTHAVIYIQFCSLKLDVTFFGSISDDEEDTTHKCFVAKGSKVSSKSKCSSYASDSDDDASFTLPSLSECLDVLENNEKTRETRRGS